MALALRLTRQCGNPVALGRSGVAGFLRLGGARCSTSQKVRLVAEKEMNQYWTKNYKLVRPLSPHLGIYKPQLTSVLSLIHRGTGIAMTIIWTTVGIAAFWFSGHYDPMIEWIRGHHIAAPLLTGFKFAIAWPACYHVINGVRHLAWDYALGFSLKATYSSGWFVLGLSILVAGFLASYTYVPPEKQEK